MEKTINNKKKLKQLIVEFNTSLNSNLNGLSIDKFQDELESMEINTSINLQNILSYENNDEWNRFIILVDKYYPGLIFKYFSNEIPLDNYLIL